MSVFGIITTLASKGNRYIDEQIEKEKRRAIDKSQEKERLREIEHRAYIEASEREAIRRGAIEGRRLAKERIERETKPRVIVRQPTQSNYGFGKPNFSQFDNMFAFPGTQQQKRRKKLKLVGYDMWNRPIYR